ncbi:uncharacterized protein si:dkeyp-110g5.4 [Osmerus mordax]|uniref:uncharacterized protein si:dkeyp-110g5.4 n=1 Tax=Osmerus mordax TaxID=8014 RepID=UPI00351081D1
MRGIHTLDNFEIYIPREAEVMTVPIGSLRVSVLQRMGVQRSRCGRRSSNASVCIWISPVVIRERVRSLNKLDASDMAKTNMASVVTQELKTKSGPYHMSFVSSNCVALRVLGEFLQVSGNETRRIPAQTSPLPHGTATKCPKDAIIIHHRRIFLSLKKPDLIRRPRGNFVTSPALPFKPQRKLVLESSAVSAKQMCHPVPPDITCDNTQREKAFLQRFGVKRFIQVTLSRLPSQDPTVLQSTSQQQPKEESLYTHHNANEQDASNINGSSKKTHNTDLKQKVEVLSVLKDDPMNQGDEQSLSKIFCTNPLFNKEIKEVGGCTGIKCSTPKKHEEEEEEDGTENGWDFKGEEEDRTENGWDFKGEEEIEARSGTEAPVTDFNTVVIKGEDATSDTAEASSDSPNVQRESPSDDSGMHLEMDDTKDGTVGDGGLSWGVEHPLVPAFSTPEQHYGFDFDQLAREEAIDRIRAKLRESEAALCSLRSLR